MLNHSSPDLRDTRVEIDLSAIRENYRKIKEMAGPETAVMAVVKANAYGHGLIPVAKVLYEEGADYLAVATLTEALQIREAEDVPRIPLFILGHTPDRLLPLAAEHDITQTIFSYEQAEILSKAALRLGKTARVHIKVDTGFHRLGKDPSPAFAEEILRMASLPGLILEGIFSHLALLNEEENERQFESFMRFTDQLAAAGLSFRYRHLADSIAAVDYPRYRLDMIRPGAVLYGMVGYTSKSLTVRPALRLLSRISQIRRVPEGTGIGYDFTWIAPRDSVLATVPAGYADGYPRALSNKAWALIAKQKAPVRGLICMDQLVIDVTDIPEAKEGSEVILYGGGEDGSLTIAEAARLVGTNKNEILSRIMERPPKIYR